MIWEKARPLTIVFMLLSILGFAKKSGAAAAPSLVEGNTAFALELYGQLKSGEGNLFFSPYSISTALAMTYAGARGQTEEQMARVLHFGKEQQQVHAAFGELQRHLREIGAQRGVELSVANALWAQKEHPFLPAFLQTATGEYQANAKQADFKTAAEAARSEINRWVSQNTKEKIKDILPPDSVNAQTKLVLANAIYFKGLWAKPYDKAETSNQPFHVSNERQVETPLMHRLDRVNYMENADFQAVELFYRSNELSMVILLPREVDGCAKLEEQLNPALLSRSLGEMKMRQVEVFLPRFKLESGFNLNSVLSKMGMPDAFEGRADFSGMDQTRLLYISGIFHKAWGEVNEEGTEAAAATTVVAMPASISKPPPPPPVFRADHPFIFLIRETRSGSPLFLGRLAQPAA